MWVFLWTQNVPPIIHKTLVSRIRIVCLLLPNVFFYSWESLFDQSSRQSTGTRESGLLSLAVSHSRLYFVGLQLKHFRISWSNADVTHDRQSIEHTWISLSSCIHDFQDFPEESAVLTFFLSARVPFPGCVPSKLFMMWPLLHVVPSAESRSLVEKETHRICLTACVSCHRVHVPIGCDGHVPLTSPTASSAHSRFFLWTDQSIRNSTRIQWWGRNWIPEYWIEQWNGRG